MPATRSREELRNLAHDFVATLEPGKEATLVALYGELGAGKTAFVKEVAFVLGVKETVTSPTFVLQKIYPLENKKFEWLIHIDAYRLERSEELKQLRWQEIVANPKNLIVLEWADRVEELLPRDAVRIRFRFVDETTREVTIEAGIRNHES